MLVTEEEFLMVLSDEEAADLLLFLVRAFGKMEEAPEEPTMRKLAGRLVTYFAKRI